MFPKQSFSLCSFFDEEAFKTGSVSGANSTKLKPIPTGIYAAKIEDVKFREVQGKKDPSKKFVFMDLPLEITLTPEAKQEMDVTADKMKMTYNFIIDVNDQGNGLDMSEGKNVSLGRLREALGQNNAGQPWRPADMIGQMLQVEIKHRVDGENTYADVKGVLPY